MNRQPVLGLKRGCRKGTRRRHRASQQLFNSQEDQFCRSGRRCFDAGACVAYKAAPTGLGLHGCVSFYHKVVPTGLSPRVIRVARLSPFTSDCRSLANFVRSDTPLNGLWPSTSSGPGIALVNLRSATLFEGQHLRDKVFFALTVRDRRSLRV